MKREDFHFSAYGDQRRVARHRAQSGRDLIRISKLTREKLDYIRAAFPAIDGYDELLYLLTIAALRDLEINRVNPGDPQGIPGARDSGKQDRSGKPSDRQVNRK